jgi:hypothetical protein
MMGEEDLEYWKDGRVEGCKKKRRKFGMLE